MLNDRNTHHRRIALLRKPGFAGDDIARKGFRGIICFDISLPVVGHFLTRMQS